MREGSADDDIQDAVNESCDELASQIRGGYAGCTSVSYSSETH